MLFIVSGASGVGKSTLCRALLDEFDSLVLSVSATTRAPRAGEVDGVHYHFVTKDRFRAMVDEGEFAEWAEVHGNLYGSMRSTIDAELAAGRSVLFDIDYQGAASLVAAYPEDTVTTMVLPPSMGELERRLRGRGTDEESVIARRLAKAALEIAQTPAFQHTIVNDDIAHAQDTLRGIFLAGRARTRRVWPPLADDYTA